MGYYTRTYTFSRGTIARSAQVNEEFTAIETAFSTAETEIDQAIRFTNADLTSPLTMSENAAARADKTLAWSDDGTALELRTESNTLIFTLSDAGKVVQVNSAGTALETGAIPAGEVVELVDPGGGATAEAASDFVTGYDYEYILNDIANTTGNFLLQAKVEVSAAYPATNYDWVTDSLVTTGAESLDAGAADTSIKMIDSTLPALAGSGNASLSGRISIINPLSATSFPAILWDLMYINSSSVPVRVTGGAAHTNAVAAFTNLQLSVSAGAFQAQSDGIVVRRSKRTLT